MTSQLERALHHHSRNAPEIVFPPQYRGIFHVYFGVLGDDPRIHRALTEITGLDTKQVPIYSGGTSLPPKRTISADLYTSLRNHGIITEPADEFEGAPTELELEDEYLACDGSCEAPAGFMCPRQHYCGQT